MRITRQIINYIKDLKKKHTQMFCTKHLKKEVEIGAHGTKDYLIKKGINKGKYCCSVSFVTFGSPSTIKIISNEVPPISTHIRFGFFIFLYK